MVQRPNEISTSVLETVSAMLEIPVETLPPISDAIDVSGLEALITDNQAHDVTITFAYAGLRVLVHSNRTVYVRPLQNGPTGPRNKLTSSRA